MFRLIILIAVIIHTIWTIDLTGPRTLDLPSRRTALVSMWLALELLNWRALEQLSLRALDPLNWTGKTSMFISWRMLLFPLVTMITLFSLIGSESRRGGWRTGGCPMSGIEASTAGAGTGASCKEDSETAPPLDTPVGKCKVFQES